MGFPYAFIICFMCFSLYFLLRHEKNEINLMTDRRFRLHILDPVTRLKPKSLVNFVFNFIAAPWTIASAGAQLLDIAFWQLLLLLGVTWGGAVGLALASIVAPDVMALSLIFYVTFAVSVATIRYAIRGVCGVAGGVMCDGFVGFCLFPAFAMQIQAEVRTDEESEKGGKCKAGNCSIMTISNS